MRQEGDRAGRLWWRCGLKTYFYLPLNQRTSSDKKPEGEKVQTEQHQGDLQKASGLSWGTRREAGAFRRGGGVGWKAVGWC